MGFWTVALIILALLGTWNFILDDEQKNSLMGKSADLLPKEVLPDELENVTIPDDVNVSAIDLDALENIQIFGKPTRYAEEEFKCATDEDCVQYADGICEPSTGYCYKLLEES